MFPAFVMARAKIDLDKRPPLRTFRLPDQVQTGFLRRVICLARVAGNAGANDVLPRGGTAAIPRNDVIQIQVLAFENFSAVLAGIAIPLENVMSGKLHFFFWQAIKHHQQNHARHADSK